MEGNAANIGLRPIGIIVLGMHRSGTSALTRVLNIVGADLPAKLVNADPSNKTGHWEPTRVVNLHKRMFADIFARWDDWRPLDPEWLRSPARLPYVSDMMRFLEEECGKSNLFLLKDPRICRLMPLWKEAFALVDMDLRVAMLARHPLEVAASLSVRNRIATGRALLIWLRHVLDAEVASRDVTRSWTSYSQLLGDWRRTVRKIGREIGFEWPRISDDAEAAVDLFLDASLRHHVEDEASAAESAELPNWIRDAYMVISAFAENGETPDGLRILDGVRTVLDDSYNVLRPAFEDEMALERALGAQKQAALEEMQAELVRLRGGGSQ
jgi:hypothetical protein